MKLKNYLFLILLSILEFQSSFAQNFHLVKDIDTSTSSDPLMITYAGLTSTAPATLNGSLFFSADDGIHGRELWRSDGTAAGTVLVSDIHAGEQSSDPQRISICRNKLFFKTTDSNYTNKVYCSDGTAEGTVMLFKTVYIYNLIVVGDMVYFCTNSALYKTDGTIEGTSLVINFDPRNFTIQALYSIHGKLIFCVGGMDNTLNGYYTRLWTTDGTEAGTRSILNNIFDPRALVEDGQDNFYINAKTSKDLSYTIVIASLSQLSQAYYISGMENVQNASLPVVVNSQLFFTAADQDNIYSLYRLSYGNGFPLHRVQQVTSGNSQSFPNSLIVSGNRLFLSTGLYNTADSSNGVELWSSDGYENTVRLLSNFDKNGAAYLGPLTGINGKLFFNFNDGMHGTEPWLSDGTVSGTALLKDILPGKESSTLWSNGFAALKGKILFPALSATGNEMWITNGTQSGTEQLKDINQKTTSGNGPNYAAARKDQVFFIAATSDLSGNDLWVSGGSADNTTKLGHLRLQPYNLGYVSFGTGDCVYCMGTNHSDGRHGLYGINLKNQSTWLIKEMNMSNSISQWAVAGKKVIYFLNTDQARNKWTWWRSDLSSGGTVPVANGDQVYTIPTYNSTYWPITIGDNLYYTSTQTGKEGLWRVGAMETSSIKLTDDLIFSHYPQPLYLTNYKGRLFFTALNTNGNRRIWSTDPDGQNLVSLEGNYTDPADLNVAGGRLYFKAGSATEGTELWSTDGKSVTLVSDINPGPSSSDPSSYTRVGGSLFFFADDGEHGIELWKTDGTSTGTLLVKDITPGPASTYGPGTFENYSKMVNVAGKLYFVVEQDGLWTSDGTALGTHPITDTGLEGVKDLQRLVAVGNRLWLTGKTYQYGQEPYIGTVAPAPLARYTFTGNGSFDDPENWLEGQVPPEDIYKGTEVIIKPAGNAECRLNQPLHIKGGKLTIAAGAKIIVPAEVSAL